MFRSRTVKKFSTAATAPWRLSGSPVISKTMAQSVWASASQRTQISATGWEDTVVGNMIVQQSPFPGASRTELEAQLQSAVKVSPKGQHVKAKINLERCVYWDSNGKPAPQPSEFARRRGRAVIEARQVWLMGRQFGVLFEVRHLTLDAVEAPCCPFISSISS